ncbi:MAG: ribulose-phosphate 3-epimerase [Thermomicrobiales bacterium]
MNTERIAQIGPSILTANLLDLGEEIRRAEAAGVDFIHLDIMDGRFVPNISFGPIVVSAVRQATTLPVDVHLMIEEPERYVEDFVRAGADRLTVHVEASLHLHRTLSRIEELGAMPGVSLVPSTPLSAITEVLPMCGQLLVMLVNPGFGGQTMIPEMLNKTERARGLIDAVNPDCLLEVDGGVKAENLGAVIAAGAETIVVGSAIYNERQSVADSVAQLRQAIG